MNEVRVFDPRGNLKRIITTAELIAISDEQLKNGPTITGARRIIPFTKYKYNSCKKMFESNSTRGAKYCKDCRKKVYRIRKKNGRNIIKKEKL